MQGCKLLGQILRPTVLADLFDPAFFLPTAHHSIECIVRIFAAFQSAQIVKSERRRQLVVDIGVDARLLAVVLCVLTLLAK